MINYHAVMIGEDGMEFGADVKAMNKHEARLKLMDMYPESRIEQLESPEDTEEREMDIYASVMEEDYDYEDDF